MTRSSSAAACICSSSTSTSSAFCAATKLGLYLCCYTTPGTEGYLEHFFSPALLEHAAAKDILGGKMQYAKMSYAYKQLFGALMTSPQYRAQYSEPDFDIARIDAFAAAMRG